MIIQTKDHIYYKDPCDRCWELTPVFNPNIMMPFLIKPIKEEKFYDAVKDYVKNPTIDQLDPETRKKLVEGSWRLKDE